MEKFIIVAVPVGSLRKASLNRMMASSLIAQAGKPGDLVSVSPAGIEANTRPKGHGA